MEDQFSGRGLQAPRTAKRGSFWNKLWYSWTAPPLPAANASLQMRENARQGRLTSIVIFILIFLNLGSIPSAVAGLNRALSVVLIVSVAALVLAVFLNRRGSVFWAGLIIVLVHAIGIMLNLFTTPTGLSFEVISSFAILIIPTLLAAALLPPLAVFVLAILSTVFCVFAITTMPHAVGFTAPMSLIIVQGVVLPGVVQGATAGISFLWVSSLQRALRERDQAEEVIRLERDLSEQAEAMARQKEQLEQSIDMILHTQMRVANGDLNARVPLTSENVLWPVAGTLNNLITRLQRSYTAGKQLEHTKASADWLVSILRKRKAGQLSPQYTRTGTMIDPIAMELFTASELQRQVSGEQQPSAFSERRPR